MNTNKLKKDFLEQFKAAERAAYQPVPQEDVDIIVNGMIDGLPEQLFKEISKEASTPAKDLFISFLSYFSNFNPSKTQSGRVVNIEMWTYQILPAFAAKIKNADLSIRYEPAKEYLVISIESIRKFCNYEKVKTML